MKLKVPYPWVECCLLTKKKTFAQNISPSPLMCPEMPLYTAFQPRGCCANTSLRSPSHTQDAKVDMFTNKGGVREVFVQHLPVRKTSGNRCFSMVRGRWGGVYGE